MKTFHNQEIKPHRQRELLSLLPSVVRKDIIDAFGQDVTEEVLTGESAEGNEDLFQSFEEVLPKDLVKRNVADCVATRKNVAETLHFLLSQMEKRASTWEIDGEEPYKEEAIATIQLLSTARFNTELFLGKGNAGYVFIAPGTENYCIKYIHTPEKQLFSIEEEFTILGQVNDVALSFKALRIPQAHCIAKNIDGKKNFFTMEKITGLTLEQLIEFPSKRKTEYPDLNGEQIIELLENSLLRDKLLQDLHSLHDAGIIHGDIHPKNMMLNRTGEICLIDFGNAVIPVNAKTTATYDGIENIKELDIKAFINSIKKTISDLRRQLTY